MTKEVKMFNRSNARKSLLMIVLALTMLLSSCGWLDKAGTTALDKGFGNTSPCSGIVCP